MNVVLKLQNNDSILHFILAYTVFSSELTVFS